MTTTGEPMRMPNRVTVFSVSFKPPSEWKQLPAAYVEKGAQPPYLIKALDDDDSEWNLVVEKPRTTLQLSGADEGTGFLPETTTFKFADGQTRWFAPNDPILIGPGDGQHVIGLSKSLQFTRRLLEGDLECAGFVHPIWTG